MHPDPEIEVLLAKLHHPSLKPIEPGLERVSALLAALNNPQLQLPSVVHIAGTNGKGSTLAYLTAMFQAAGLTVHRYTSPHLVRFNERILLADLPICDKTLKHYLQIVADNIVRFPVTFFEATTAAALLAFAQVKADVVLLETGLGGRLDATNVVPSPLLTAISAIGIDHAEYLGHTLEKIAAEKAGIIKPGVPCVIGRNPPEAMEVIIQIAKDRRAPLHVVPAENDVTPCLAGSHQVENAKLAVACATLLQKHFPLTQEHILDGLKFAVWPARLQRLNETMWLDGGHNPAAGKALAHWLMQQPKPAAIICGMLKTKDARGFLSEFNIVDPAIYTVAIPEETDSLAADGLADVAVHLGLKATACHTIEEAIDEAKKAKPATILVCGSLYLAGAVLSRNL